MKKFFLIVSLFSLCACATHPVGPPARSVGRPLSAIAVSACGKAYALFVQLDATHMLRSDPRQSDLFTASPDGHMTEQKGPSLEWATALHLAESASIQTHVVLPCTDGLAT